MSEKNGSERPMSILINFESHVDGDKAKPKVKYQARVTFENHLEMLEHAGESVRRILQQKWAREGKFPTGRVVEVDHKGNFVKTTEDIVKDVMRMSSEDRAAKIKEFEAIIAAAKAAQSVR